MIIILSSLFGIEEKKIIFIHYLFIQVDYKVTTFFLWKLSRWVTCMECIGLFHWEDNLSHCILNLLVIAYFIVFCRLSPHVAPQITLLRRHRGTLASTATSSCCSSNLHKHQWRSASRRSHLAVTPPRQHAVNREPSVVRCLLSRGSSNDRAAFQGSCFCGCTFAFTDKVQIFFPHLCWYHGKAKCFIILSDFLFILNFYTLIIIYLFLHKRLWVLQMIEAFKPKCLILAHVN